MYKVKSFFEIKDLDEKQGIVTGYASIFNNIDSDNEMVVPGAFAKTIQERGPSAAKPRIKHLWQHNTYMPIALPTILREDSKGLYFESKFGTDQFSRDKFLQHVDGIITELSIGYNIVKWEKAKRSATDETWYYKLTELMLWEYSSVTWGANSLTEIISAKGVTIESKLEQLNNRMNALAKGLKNGSYTDELLNSFEIEIKQIQEAFNTMILKPEAKTTSIEPDKTTHELNYDFLILNL